MKKHFLVLLTWLSIICLQAKAPAIQWQKSLGGTNSEVPHSICQTRDGGYISIGWTISTDFDISDHRGEADIWIVKLNSSGIVEWKRCLGGSLLEDGTKIQQTIDGGFIICGSSTSKDIDVPSNAGDYDVLVAKLDTLGNTQWIRTFGGSRLDLANDIRQTKDQGFIIAGESSSSDGDLNTNKGASDYWLIKLDIGGQLQWQKTYGGSGYDIAHSVLQTSDGGYIAAGESSSGNGDVTGNHGNIDYWVIKVDNAGNLKWQVAYGGSMGDNALDLAASADGNYYITGQTYSSNFDVKGKYGGNNNQDIWLLKIDPQGTLIWQKCIGGSGAETFFSVSGTYDGGCVMTGFAQSHDGDLNIPYLSKDFAVIKVSSSGKVQWHGQYGGTAYGGSGLGVCQTTDGGYIIAGMSKSVDGDISSNHGDRDWWIVKLKPEPFSIVGDPVFCSSYTGRFETSRPDLQYTWKLDGKLLGHGDTLSFRYIIPGRYMLTAYVDTLGYEFSDTQMITVLPLPASDLPETDSACKPINKTLCAHVNQKNTKIAWDNGSGDTCRVFTAAGIYTIRYDNGYCIVPDTITIFEKPLPVFKVMQLDTPCLDGSAVSKLVIQPDSFPEMLWLPDHIQGNMLSIQNVEERIARVTGANGCSAEMSFTPVTGCSMTWFIPDAFSPNGDGRNDILLVIGTEISSVHMAVFNRWGEKVFETDDKEQGWDGKYNGTTVQEGYYMVHLQVQSVLNSKGSQPIQYYSGMILLTY
jgi:gliding motility-associated-like protein